MSNPYHYRRKAKARRKKRHVELYPNIFNPDFYIPKLSKAQEYAISLAIYEEICAGLRAARKAGVDCSPVPYNLTIEPMEKTPVVVTDHPCPPVFGHRVIEHPETCGDWGVIFDGRPGMEPVVYVGSKMYEKLKAEWDRKEMK